MSLAIDVLEPSALLIVCQVLDGALLTRLRGVKPGIGGAANVRFCLKSLSLTERPERSALKTEWTQKWGDFFACYYMNRSHAMVSFS